MKYMLSLKHTHNLHTYSFDNRFYRMLFYESRLHTFSIQLTSYSMQVKKINYKQWKTKLEFEIEQFWAKDSEKEPKIGSTFVELRRTHFAQWRNFSSLSMAFVFSCPLISSLCALIFDLIYSIFCRNLWLEVWTVISNTSELALSLVPPNSVPCVL